MILSDEINSQINKLSKEDWDKLFALIPEIEATEKFSYGGEIIKDKNDPEKLIATHEFEIKLVIDFVELMYELDLVIGFNWAHWKQGKTLFQENNYNNLDTVTLLKLLTAFIRADHFSYGSALASRFEDGSIEKILKELKKNIQGK